MLFQITGRPTFVIGFHDENTDFIALNARYEGIQGSRAGRDARFGFNFIDDAETEHIRQINKGRVIGDERLAFEAGKRCMPSL